MGYQISIEYTTGDSFGSEEEEEVLDLVFKDLSVAEENLTRIKEHYDYFNNINSCQRHSTKNPVKPTWFDKETTEYSIVLKTDTGENCLIGCFWIGYFESLIEIKIVSNELPYYIF